jgi:hypothetical protein
VNHTGVVYRPRVASSDAVRFDEAEGSFPGPRPVVPPAVPPLVSLARQAARHCARPNCAADAQATLGFDYGARDATIEPLRDEPHPQTYDLCAVHAARTTPPRGWRLHDRRPADERLPDLPTATPADLGGDRTVALLAAALRAVPDPVSEDAVSLGVAEVGPALAPHTPRPVLAVRDRDEAPLPPTLWT